MFGTLPLIVAGGAVAGLIAVAAIQTARVKSLRVENSLLTLQLDACAARTRNILEDRSSDQEIDNIPDADLPGATDPRWLRNGAGSPD